MAKRRKRRYSRGASTEVEREMLRYKRGTARSGRGGRADLLKERFKEQPDGCGASAVWNDGEDAFVLVLLGRAGLRDDVRDL